MLEQQRNQNYFNASALFSFSLILSLNNLHKFFNALNFDPEYIFIDGS